DFDSRRPIGRLAARLPSFDEGTLSVLTDGRMRVEYQLRSDVTWHDGTPFTANDLMFSYRMATDKGLPVIDSKLLQLWSSAEVLDDHRFAIYFKRAYYQAHSLGPRLFWVHPRHLLEPAYEKYLA